MLLDDFNYVLPPSLIAQEPHYKRGESRLLVLDKKSGQSKDDHYKNLPDYLNKNDVVVLNNTKVFKARLKAQKSNGAIREIIILEKHGLKDDWHSHKVMYRGHLRAGELLEIGVYQLRVEKLSGDGTAIIGSQTDLLEIAKKYGTVPLPPYIKRLTIKNDEATYQTIWAKHNGSVAAPTASLNMTQATLEKLKSKGVKVVYVTLHVGLGTFMPIRTRKLEDHIMHSEFFEIPKVTFKAIKDAKANGGRILAVGTTVARTLEYNKHSLINQPPVKLSGEANIFIYPGYNFKIVDMLLTNFHVPKSTVLMMAAAFTGWDNLKKAYDYAKLNNYWFLSYGDSMLIR
jgi:S-adenosylmethionine:tRNA ribosyltransferase-isomerase